MGKLLHTEWYKIIHDKVYWITLAATVLFNAIVFSGNSVFGLTGQGALESSMKKEIATVIIVYIYGGLFIGGDFADRTFYHGLMVGKSRSSVLFAKSIVFTIAANGLLFFFPLLLVLFCTVKNGWGTAVPAGLILHIVSVVIAMLILGLAIGMLCVLAAVCFRDIGRTIGVPILLSFIMIILLNSTFAEFFAKIFPFSALFCVANGMISPADGILLGIAWFALMLIISTLVFRRAELR